MTPLYPGYATFATPSYVFLIHHAPTNTRLLYDLGTRTDWESSINPHIKPVMKQFGVQITVEKDVPQILGEAGVEVESIDAVVLSHHHFDHVGDPRKLGPLTKLFVGPGFKQRYLPGWPINPEDKDSTSDTYEAREIVELLFDGSDQQPLVEIAGFKALDYFNDGSFYILSTPGHTASHLSALARTTSTEGGESTFIFMAGDLVHTCMCFRPSENYPLPETISPSPIASPFSTTSSLQTLPIRKIHRLHDHSDSNASKTQPMCLLAGYEEDLPTSQANATVLSNVFDSDENVLTVYAHDEGLLDVIEFFPQEANAWKEKGWGKQGHWRFLAPIVRALEGECVDFGVR